MESGDLCCQRDENASSDVSASCDRVSVSTPDGRQLILAAAPVRKGASFAAWSLAVASPVMIGIALWLGSGQEVSSGFDLTTFISLGALFVAFPLVGALVAGRMPRNPTGWIYSASPALIAAGVLAILTASLIQSASSDAGSWPGWWAMLGSALFALGVGVLGVFGLLLFPDGHLPGRGWRWSAAFGAVSICVTVWTLALAPRLVDDPLIVNPVDLGSIGGVIDEIGAYAVLAVGLAVMVAALSLVARYRRSTGPEKTQLSWLGLVSALLVVALVAGFVVNAAGLDDSAIGLTVRVVTWISVLGVPVSIGFAVLRRGLYGAAPMVTRSVVYMVLTILLASVFGVVVGATTMLFPGDQRLGGVLLAAAVVAVIVQPLRDRVQRRVTRLFYGYRDEPYRAMLGLGRRLGDASTPENVLAEIADAIAVSLRVPSVSVEMITSRDTVRVDHREPRHGVTEVPLSVRGDVVGRLIVGHREPGQKLGNADLHLLEVLATQAAIAVEASRLALELQESRNGLVAAREDERLRIRRDLHDGLGSALTGVGLGLHAAASQLGADDPAHRLLEDLIVEIGAAIEEVRRIVADLRPPLLDELGLEGAICEQAQRLSHRTGTLAIVVDVDKAVSGLPTAIEAAAYRIATEALTNVAKHSGAQHCAVRITVPEQVHVEVVDDGIGLGPGSSSGNGISSMHRRAEELGGVCAVYDAPGGGTRVEARLPVTLAGAT